MKLPPKWRMEPFDQLVDFQEGLVSPTQAPFNKWLHVGADNIQSGGGLIRGLQTCEQLGLTSGKYPFRPGAIIYSKIRPYLNKVCRVDFEGVCSADAYPLYVHETELKPDFLVYLMRSDRFVRQAVATSMRTGMPKINRQDLGNLEVPVPPLPEQQKIADILGTWDEALEKLDALIAAKARRKQALMQQLLTGHRRMPGFSKPWAQTTFGQFLTESRIEGSDGLTAQKITVKLYGRGVLAKQERMVGSSNTKYFIRRAGQLIYSKLDFLNGAFGIIPPELDGYESTLDLPSFDVKPSADVRWLLAYLVRPEFYEKQVGAAAGGRIARRVNPPEFLKLRLKAPEITEQRAIAAVLDTADAELRHLRQQRTALDHQKRGLMQQLLTGKVRVAC